MTNSSIFKIVNINMFIFALINVILIPGIMFSNHSTLNESLFLNSKVLMISFFIINMNLISCTVVECIMNIRSFNKEFFFLILNVTSLNLAIFTFLVLRSFDFICLSILTFILVMLLHLRSIVRLEAFERKSVSSLPNWINKFFSVFNFANITYIYSMNAHAFNKCLHLILNEQILPLLKYILVYLDKYL